MDFKTFKKLSPNYSAIPVYREVMADTLTPVSLFLSIREEAAHPFLLESVEGGEQLARYSFLGRNPYQVLRYSGGNVTLRRDEKTEKLKTDYFTALEELTTVREEPQIADLPRFTGGAVGFSGYDTIRDIEELPGQPKDDLHLPDAIWAFYDEIFAFDHVKQRVVLIKTVFKDASDRPASDLYQNAIHSLDKMEQLLRRPNGNTDSLQINTDDVNSNTTKERFVESVKKIKRYIFEGDIFQAVLSQRFEVPFKGDRFMLYRALRMVNPSPYMFYLDFDGLALAGSSPEVLSRLNGKQATLLPIAGTRARGETDEKDRALETELRNDPKEISEHVMLVDLGRNDLSRVCEPGSVYTVKDKVIMRYSHVMHMVSELQGRLVESENAVSLLMKTFPAGTVSGAPKVRAMEIIDELEPTKRGPYAGAVGYFDYSGNMDTCIAIRTMVIKDDNIYIQAGAGIVADSDPDKEYLETKNKAAALIEALNVASDVKNNTPHESKYE